MFTFPVAHFSSSAAGFDVGNALLFNQADSAVLKRTPSSASNRNTWTFSFWMKRGQDVANSVGYGIFSSYSAGNDSGYFESGIHPSEDHYFIEEWSNDIKKTSAELRDTHSWYNIVLAIDTTQSTAEDRQKIYINGTRVTEFDTDNTYDEDQDLAINTNAEHWIGGSEYFGETASTRYFDGMLADINFTDGTAYDSSAFGELNDNGVWVPVNPSVTYGTNGFRLEFKQTGTGTASTTTIGADTSGNNNHWTSVNLASTDVVTDSPTNNKATWSSISYGPTTSSPTLNNGNLDIPGSGLQDRTVGASFAVSGSGKYYWEYEITSGSGGTPSQTIGMHSQPFVHNTWSLGGTGGFRGYHSDDGDKVAGSTDTSYGDAWTTNGIRLGVAVDLDNGAIYFAQNNTWQNSGNPTSGSSKTGAAFTDLTSGVWSPFVASSGNRGSTAIFNEDDFEYTPPTGYVALATKNMPDPTVADPTAGFKAVAYTGNGSTQSITVGFQPDLVLIKNRDAADQWCWFDSVRGATKLISSNPTTAEAADADTLTSFDSTGFSIGADDKVNTNTEKYIAWCWKAGGSASSNEVGSINTIGTSVSTDYGISIGKFTGNGSAGATVGHGLGKAPAVVITKNLEAGETMYMGCEPKGFTHGIYMSSTAAPYDIDIYFNDVSPSSTVVTFKTHAMSNDTNDDQIMYCFSNIDKFCHHSSYTGNGNADGPMVYLPYKPALLLIRNITGSGSWVCYDSTRTIFNPTDDQLLLESTAAETSGSELVDMLSNGFKIRSTSGSVNTSGSQYLYMSWAENNSMLRAV